MSSSAMPIQGALGHRGSVARNGYRAGWYIPSVSAAGGKATPPITGGGTTGGKEIGRPTIARKGHRRADGATSDRSFHVPPESTFWYGSEGLHQAVAPAIGV